MSDLLYIYRWNRMGRKGERCAVTARGTMNSCLVVFADGFRMVTSRNAIRKAEKEPELERHRAQDAAFMAC
jgi:hypothetical protein